MMRMAFLAALIAAFQTSPVAEAARVIAPDCEPQKKHGGERGNLPANSFGAPVFQLVTEPVFETEEVHLREFLASYNESSLVGEYVAPSDSEPRDPIPAEIIGYIQKDGEIGTEPPPRTLVAIEFEAAEEDEEEVDNDDDQDDDSEEDGDEEEEEGEGRRLRRDLNVFLPDTRAEVNENAYPYRTVGKWRGCTATLVGQPGIVITNAHCLKYKADGTMDPSMWNTEFFAAYNNGVFLAKSKPKAIWYDKGSDYAVLKLWTNIDITAGLGRMGVWYRSKSFFNSKRDLKMISYSGDHCTAGNNCRQKLSSGSSRGVRASSNDLYHDLDAKRGSSGSAMWKLYSGIPVMDALNWGENRNGGEVSLTLPSYTGLNPNLAKPAGVVKYGIDKVKNY